MQVNRTVIDAARSSAAWRDAGKQGVVTASGKDRLDLLHRLTTNDLTHVPVGHGKQTVLLTEKARIIDVLTVLQDSDHALLLTSPAMADVVVRWLRKYIIMDDVRVHDSSERWHRVDVIGPYSASVVSELFHIDASAWSLCQWERTPAPSPLTIVRIPSVTELAYAVIGEQSAVSEVVTTMREALPELQPTDHEFLRICAGMPASKSELSEEYNPLEANLLHLTSFTKGCYIGQEVVARLDSYNKVKQRIVGITASSLLSGESLTADGERVGLVTSVSADCTGSAMCGLAYLRTSHAIPGSTVFATESEQAVYIHQLPMDIPCL